MRKPGKHQFVPGIRYLRSIKSNLKYLGDMVSAVKKRTYAFVFGSERINVDATIFTGIALGKTFHAVEFFVIPPPKKRDAYFVKHQEIAKLISVPGEITVIGYGNFKHTEKFI